MKPVSQVRFLATACLAIAVLAIPSVAGADRTGGRRVFLCGGLEATIVGTPGPDRLSGGSASDVIVGLGGNDVIKGHRVRWQPQPRCLRTDRI